eukprot:TRINITY_DN32002_c0_g1_i2.p1 TRINITY_DN32002_c0_g1~~TRINITY_DN32002_c0_g1_i2.p1  ORF type:complete len:343 (-),score=21.58 TRINITY_DN32002_c0_g1_i2:243-1202(-)
MSRDKKEGSIFSKYVARELKGHKKKVYSVGWDRSGGRLATGGQDCKVLIWSLSKGKETNKAEFELSGHSEGIDHLMWDPSHDKILATTALDKTVRIWDLREAKVNCNTIHTPGSNMYVAWHPNGWQLAVGNKQNSICFLDTRKNKIFKKHQFDFEVDQIGFANQGHCFLMATGKGSVDVVSYPSMERIRSMVSHTGLCSCFAVSRDERYMATTGSDALVALWEMKCCACIRTWAHREQPMRSLDFSCDSQYLAFASEDSFIDIVSTQTGEISFSIPCKVPSDSLAWNPYVQVMAYAGDERPVTSTKDLQYMGIVVLFSP